MRHTMDFIMALKNASLDDPVANLSTDTLQQLRNPPNEITETTLRAKPKELPHGTLRRNRIGDLRAKDPKRARMESLWVLDCSSIYITLHVSCARLSMRLYATRGCEHSCHPVVRLC